MAMVIEAIALAKCLLWVKKAKFRADQRTSA
jgi:hypothetical protein